MEDKKFEVAVKRSLEEHNLFISGQCGTGKTYSGLLVAHFENIGFYIGSSYSKYRLFTGFSIKIQVKKRVFQTYIKI